jgi:hypothetical protein
MMSRSVMISNSVSTAPGTSASSSTASCTVIPGAVCHPRPCRQRDMHSTSNHKRTDRARRESNAHAGHGWLPHTEPQRVVRHVARSQHSPHRAAYQHRAELHFAGRHLESGLVHVGPCTADEPRPRTPHNLPPPNAPVRAARCMVDAVCTLRWVPPSMAANRSLRIVRPIVPPAGPAADSPSASAMSRPKWPVSGAGGAMRDCDARAVASICTQQGQHKRSPSRPRTSARVAATSPANSDSGWPQRPSVVRSRPSCSYTTHLEIVRRRPRCTWSVLSHLRRPVSPLPQRPTRGHTPRRRAWTT